MKSKLKKLNGCSRSLEVKIPKEAVDKIFDEVISELKKTAKIPGFRPGNAPDDIIRKNYKEDIHDEVKRRLIPIGYQSALQEHNLDPISYPEVSDIVLELSGVLTFKAKLDVYPEVNVKNYKGIKVTKEKVTIDEKEVQDALTRVQNMYADFADTKDPLKKGEFAICDVETFMDGKSISKKRENMWIEVDKDASMLGLGEKLLGLKKGDKKDIIAKLPENYPDKKYANKDAEFKIEIKETKEKKTPALDAELAKKVGKENIDEVKTEIKGQLLERKENNQKIVMENQIMTDFLKRYKFDAPESMVKRQLKVLMDRAENDLLSKGVTKEEIEKHKEKLEDQLKKEADDKVRMYFILTKIADEEKIEVTEGDVEIWMNALAKSYNQPVENVKKYYTENNLVEGVKEQLREEKTLEFLLNEAQVTEK